MKKNGYAPTQTPSGTKTMRKSQMSVDGGVMVVEVTNSRQETGEDWEYIFIFWIVEEGRLHGRRM